MVMPDQKEININREILKTIRSVDDTTLTQLRSEEVQEILSRKPGFFERWSLLVYLSILIFLFAATWFIKYPEIVQANGILISANAPRQIVSQTEGTITKVFVHNEDSVQRNAVIAFMESTGNHDEVIELNKLTDSGITLLQKGEIEKVSGLFQKQFQNLGELQISYQQLISVWQHFNDYLINGFKRRKLSELEHDISQQKDIFEQSLRAVKSLSDDWIKKYIIKAPVDGKVDFIFPPEENEYLQSKRVLGFVTPTDSRYYAQVTLPQGNLGKVSTGQIVQLRFDAYPFQEFGYVEGKLRYISRESSDSGFLANIELTNGLRTNLKKEIQFKNGLKLKAYVLVKEFRLLQRFFDSILNGSQR